MALAWPKMESTGPRVTERQVRDLEDQLGTTFPEDYRRFLLEVNGGKPASRQSRIPLATGGVLLRDLHSVSSLGEPFGLSTRIARLRERVPYPLIPIGSAGGASHSGVVCLCLEGRERGTVWYFVVGSWHGARPVACWQDRPDIMRVADGFAAFVLSLCSQAA
jgi:hypothetical protein